MKQSLPFTTSIYTTYKEISHHYLKNQSTYINGFLLVSNMDVSTRIYVYWRQYSKSGVWPYVWFGLLSPTNIQKWNFRVYSKKLYKNRYCIQIW